MLYLRNKKTFLRISYDNTFLNGLLTSAVRVLTTGPVLTAFALTLGAGNIALGFLQSIFHLSNLVHLPVSYFLEKGISSKKITVYSAFLAQPFLLLASLCPFIANKPLALSLFIINYFLFYLLTTVSGGAFWPWIKELVHPKLMNSFFAHRLRYIMLVRLITTGFVSLCLLFFKKYLPNDLEYVYIGCFFGAFILDIYGVFCFTKITEKRPVQEKATFLKKIKSSLTNKNFIHLLINLCLVNFALNFAISFFIVFILKDLALSAATPLLLSTLQQFTDMSVIKKWSHLSKKTGLFKMLSLSLFLYIIPTSLFFILSICHIAFCFVVAILIIAFILIGIVNAGLNLGITDAAISYVPKKNASVYISITNTARFCSAALAPLFAGLFLELLQSFCPQYGWSIFFLVTGLLFFIIASFLYKTKQSPL